MPSFDDTHHVPHDATHHVPSSLSRVPAVCRVRRKGLHHLVIRSTFVHQSTPVSVVLSYLAALGLTAIALVHLGPDSGLNFVLPFFMFVFLMALGPAYNILVMTRIREEAHKMPLQHAVSHAVGISGGTITTAGVILAGTFAVLAVAAGNGSGADQVRQIGGGIAAGVLMDTFVIRTILVPSLVVLVDPSRHREHCRIHVPA